MCLLSTGAVELMPSAMTAMRATEKVTPVPDTKPFVHNSSIAGVSCYFLPVISAETSCEEDGTHVSYKTPLLNRLGNDK